MNNENKIYKVVAVEKATGQATVIKEDLTRDGALKLAFKLSTESNEFKFKVTK